MAARPHRVVQVFSDGRIYNGVRVWYATAQVVGRYMNAVKKFLRPNNVGYLRPFNGVMITDIGGRQYILETRPNVLYRIHASGAEPYEQIYRIVY